MPNNHKVNKREVQKEQRKLDLNDVEMVFGSPDMPKTGPPPDVHSVANEKKLREGSNSNGTSEEESLEQSLQPTAPLLQPDQDSRKPPLIPATESGVGDLNGSHPSDATPYPDNENDSLEKNEKDASPGNNDEDLDNEVREHNEGRRDAEDDGTNGLGTRFGMDDRPGSPMMSTIPDVNTYQQKKNLAQGMMDLALLSANANQLRYVLESSVSHPYYYPSLVFISLSIIFQVAVGIGLIVNSRYNVKDEKDICKADKINNMTVLGVFLITIVNVFITSFSVASPAAAAAVVAAGKAGQT